MNMDFADAMRAATQLTRAQKLMEPSYSMGMRIKLSILERCEDNRSADEDW